MAGALGFTGAAEQRVAGIISASIGGAAGAIASAATRSAIDGTSFGDGIIAAIPDVIGQALNGYISACFVGDTPIHTPKGLKRIDEIKVGDWVLARDEDFRSPTVHRKQVEQLFRYEDRTTLDVAVADRHDREEIVRTTPEHPFAIEGVGWVQAGDLKVGQTTIDIDGNHGRITSITPVEGLHTVHNFSVSDDHTYFVAKQGVWVHNRNYDAIAEGVESPVKDVQDSEFNLAMPTEAQSLAAYYSKSFEPFGSELLALGMIGRGAEEAVKGLLEFGELVNDFRDGSIMWKAEAILRSPEARGELAAGGAALTEDAWEFTKTASTSTGRFALASKFKSWLGQQFRDDMVDAGTALYLGDGGALNTLSAGYQMDFTGQIAFEGGMTLATGGLANLRHVGKVNKIDDVLDLSSYIGKTVDLDPSTVGLTQSWVSYQKAGNSFNFDDIVASMRTDGWKGSPIDAVIMNDGVLSSIDNTRVLAARVANIKIPTQVHGFGDNIMDIERMLSLETSAGIPSTWGQAATFRINKSIQNKTLFNGNVPDWNTRFPDGSIYDPHVYKPGG